MDLEAQLQAARASFAAACTRGRDEIDGLRRDVADSVRALETGSEVLRKPHPAPSPLKSIAQMEEEARRAVTSSRDKTKKRSYGNGKKEMRKTNNQPQQLMVSDTADTTKVACGEIGVSSSSSSSSRRRSSVYSPTSEAIARADAETAAIERARAIVQAAKAEAKRQRLREQQQQRMRQQEQPPLTSTPVIAGDSRGSKISPEEWSTSKSDALSTASGAGINIATAAATLVTMPPSPVLPDVDATPNTNPTLLTTNITMTPSSSPLPLPPPPLIDRSNQVTPQEQTSKSLAVDTQGYSSSNSSRVPSPSKTTTPRAATASVPRAIAPAPAPAERQHQRPVLEACV